MAEPTATPAMPSANRFDFEKLFPVEQGEPLPDDAPGDDRTDTALEARTRGYQQSDDLNWLLEGAELPEDEPEEEELDEDDTDVPGLAGAAAMDLVKGAVEGPRQVVGGMRDAVQSTLDLADTAAQYLEERFPLGGFQILDKEGNFSPDLLSPAELKASRKAGQTAGPLPEVGEASTVTGSAVRVISQFLTGFGAAGRAIGGLTGATKVGTALRMTSAGAISDFAAFDAQGERLSNLVQEFPALANPVTEYLAAKPDDGEAEGRMKNAVEGLGLGALSGVLFRGLKTYKAWQGIARSKNAAKRIAVAHRLVSEEQMLREAGEMSLLGRAGDASPLVVKNKANRAAAETETGVPADVAARSLTTRGLTPLNAAGDVYVNFARINAPEDIRRIIKDASSAFKEPVEGATRGVRTNAETLLSAQDVDAWNVLLTRRTGQPLNAEQSVAARELWATAADKLGQVANLASQTPTPENLFQFRRMLATFHAIQKEVIGARTETARALQSWAIPVGGNLERMRDMTQALESAGGMEEAAKLARSFASLAGLNNGKVAAMAQLAEKTFYQKALGTVQEYWINALLSGPKTHMVNVASNAGVLSLAALEHGVAARLGRVFSDEAGVEIGEAAAMAAGIRGAIVDAFRNAGKAFVTGQTGYGVNKIEMPRQRYISSGTWNKRSSSWLGSGIDALGAIVNVPGKLLQAEDEFFKTIGYRQHIHSLAHRTVAQEIREGKIKVSDARARYADILENPPEAIRMDAVANAAYQTFTSEQGPIVKGIQSVIAKRPELKFILPFVNTPANILKYTFERSPLAPISAKYRAAIAEGGAKADLARTRMALGTMALLYAIDLGMNGHITGSGPSDREEQANWRRQGYQPFSLRVGDKSIAYNRLDPPGYTLGVGAKLAEYLMNSDNDDVAESFERGLAASAFAVAENVTSKSYLEGISTLIDAFNDESGSLAYNWVKRFAGSFVPAGVGEAARFVDPVQREAGNVIDSIKRRLPFFSEGQPARRDLWGRPITYQSGFGKTFDTLSPLYGSTLKPEPIDLFMQQDGWFIGNPQHFFTIDGESVSLKDRPDIKSRWYELQGGTKASALESDKLLDKYGDATLLETLNAVVTGKHDLSGDFEEIETAEDREDFIQKIVRDYRGEAKKALFREFPWITETALRKKAVKPQ